MSRYANWFSQDIGHIMENELEDVLDEFREIVEFKFELAPKVEALVETRDLLIEIHSLISERESLKENFSVGSILKMINNPIVPIVSENMLKTLKSNFEVIQSRSSIVEITYPNHIRMMKDLEGYIWKLEVQTLLNNKYNQPMPNVMYKMYRNCPDMNCGEELRKLGKKLKISPLDPKEIKKVIFDWLNEKNNNQESRRNIEKALISETKGEENLEQVVRLANRIIQNEQKLSEQTVQQLIDFGFGNTKMVQHYLGKETASKKLSEIDNTDSAGVFKEKDVPEETDLHQQVVRSHSNDGYSFRSGTGSCDKKDDDKKKSTEGTPVKEEKMDTEEIPAQAEEIVEKEELFVPDIVQTGETSHKEAAPMIEEKLPEPQEEIIHDYVTIQGQELTAQIEIFNFEKPIDEKEPEELPEPSEDDESPMQEEALLQQDTFSEKMDEELPATVPVAEAPANVEPVAKKEEMRERPLPRHSQTIPFDEAIKYYREGRKPGFFPGTPEDFSQHVEFVDYAMKKLANRIEIESLAHILRQLPQIPIEVKGIEKWFGIWEKAKTLRTKVVEMSPDTIVEQKDEIESEYKTVKELYILEVERILEEVERDKATRDQVNEAMTRIESLTFEDLTLLKNKYIAARYYKEDLILFKVYDMYIMSMINAWKVHDYEKGQTRMDYLTLKEIYMTVVKDEANKKRYIKPDNAEFIVKLYETVRRDIEVNIANLKLEDLKDSNLERSYKRFIDLTSKVTEFKAKLYKEEKKRLSESSRLAIALKPSGLKSKINRRIDYEHISGKYFLIKPAFINRITPEHRKYFLASIKYHLEANKWMLLGHEGSYKLALKLEKDLFEKNLSRAINYENNGQNMIKVLITINNFKYISYKIVKYSNRYECLMKLKGFGFAELTTYEGTCKTQFKLAQENKLKTEEMIVNHNHTSTLESQTEDNSESQMMQEKGKTSEGAPKRDYRSSKDIKYKLSKNQDIELIYTSLISSGLNPYRIFEGDFVIGSTTKKRFSNVGSSYQDRDELARYQREHLEGLGHPQEHRAVPQVGLRGFCHLYGSTCFPQTEAEKSSLLHPAR